ncbi:MAG: efflux RND transporter periplasmic adaptor subunit [Bacteroidales bacterium]|nr:efflux RND transporter periplasmic adaptor subunit [Bacteroidales bacterium]
MIHARIFASALSLLLIASGCGQRRENQDESAKLGYKPSVNEVEAIRLERKSFPLQILSNGKLEAARKTSLSFKGSGVIREVNFGNGDRVQEGQVIARLDDSSEKIALESASINLRKAELDYLDVLAGLGYSSEGQATEEVRDLALIRSGLASARNEFAKASAALEATMLKAPISGKLANISLRAYDSTDGKQFCTIVDDSSFDVVFSILESEYPLVEKGQLVRIRPFGKAEGESRTGRIRSVNPSIDENGQIEVRANISGDASMIDGMNVKVTVDKHLDNMLVVPKSAVVIRDNMDVLFRYRDGKAEWVYVSLLGANSDSYALVANESRAAVLNEGDMVIVSGNLNLADGSSVQLKAQ